MFLPNTNLHLNRVLVGLLDHAKFYGSTLRAESNGEAFIDCRNSAGEFCDNCRVCEAYRAGAEYGWDQACDQIDRRTEEVVASINANVPLLQEECSRLQSELAALKLVNAPDNLPRTSAEQPVLIDQVQVARESKLCEDNAALKSRVAALEKKLATSKRTHELELHSKVVELEKLREEFKAFDALSNFVLSSLVFYCLIFFIFLFTNSVRIKLRVSRSHNALLRFSRLASPSRERATTTNRVSK